MAATVTIELPFGMTSPDDTKPDERKLVIAAQRGSSEWRSHLERDLEPARVVVVHRGALDLYTAPGVVGTRLPGRLTFAGTEIAV